MGKLINPPGEAVCSKRDDAIHVFPCYRAEITGGGFDARFFLEFHEGVLRENPEVLCHAVNRELPCGGACIVGDEE